jgi:hypothetical protein
MEIMELVRKSADADLVCEISAVGTKGLIEEARTGAPKGTRTPDRATQRTGRIHSAIPKLRKGSLPAIISGATSDDQKALLAVI